MKINVIGVSGSGKSTLSHRLSQFYQAPCIELDEIYWKPNWEGSTTTEVKEKLKQRLEEGKNGWILDGCYTYTQEIKWKEVDFVIWLDYSWWRTIYQVTRRAIDRIWNQTELWPGTGNRETFWRTFFTKKSIIWFTIERYWRVRERYVRDMANHQNVRFIRLTSPAEVELFFKTLRK